jgi:hypothetical protein
MRYLQIPRHEVETNQSLHDLIFDIKDHGVVSLSLPVYTILVPEDHPNISFIAIAATNYGWYTDSQDKFKILRYP